MRMPQACCAREALALVSCVVALMLADAVDWRALVALMLADAVDRRARAQAEDAADELSALQKHLELKGPTLPKVLAASS